MNRWMIVMLFVLFTLVMAESKCYTNWSRCTPQTKFLTGIMWKNCPDYCKKCKGQPVGRCVRVFNRKCSGGYQCQCFGPVGRKSKNPIEIATCKLGL